MRTVALTALAAAVYAGLSALSVMEMLSTAEARVDWHMEQALIDWWTLLEEGTSP